MAVIKVFDRLPSVGDALFLVSGVKTWVRYSESAPSGGTLVGTVFHRDGHKVYTLDKSATTKKYKTENTADGAQYTSNWCFKKTGAKTNYRGILNIAKAVDYFGTDGTGHGGRTPTANEPLFVEDYNTTAISPVTRTAFENSGYCKLLRQTYASYESYIGENYGVKFPQEDGCFGLPDGKTITYALNNSAHPGFQYCAGVTYNVDGLAAGDWYMPGVYEGTALMRDAVLAKVAATMTKFGGTAPNNSAYRWFAQRYSSGIAWIFGGGGGNLNSSYCADELTVQAVSLLIV